MDEAKIEPSIEYEQLLREISKGIDVIANSVEENLRRLQKLDKQSEASLGRMADFIAEMKRLEIHRIRVRAVLCISPPTDL